jgi:hypothetical protein
LNVVNCPESRVIPLDLPWPIFHVVPLFFADFLQLLAIRRRSLSPIVDQEQHDVELRRRGRLSGVQNAGTEQRRDECSQTGSQ